MRDSALHTLQEAKDKEWTRKLVDCNNGSFWWEFYDSDGNYRGYSKMFRKTK